MSKSFSNFAVLNRHRSNFRTAPAVNKQINIPNTRRLC